MSVNVYALTSVARLKAYLGISSSDYDAIFEYIINSVTDFIENECDRRFKKTDYTASLVDGSGSNELVLPQWPVVSGETFTLWERDTVEYGDSDWDALDSDDYRVDNSAGVVKASFRFLRGFENYKILYTAGYDIDVANSKYLSDIGLGDLENIVWKLCARAFNERKGSGNIQRMRLYNYDVTFSKEAYSDDEIKEVLQKYQRVSF